MKLKKILFSLLAVLLFSVISSQLVSASTITENPINLSERLDYDNLEIHETDGTILIFDNLSDMENYVKAFEQPAKYKDSDMQPLVFGESLIGTENKKFVFLGYSKFTPDWQKNSQYTTSKGESQTYSNKVTTKWGDVSVSHNHTEGVTRTIPANSKKWSRLAGYADLKIERYKITQPSFGTIYTTKTKKLNVYTAVKYK